MNCICQEAAKSRQGINGGPGYAETYTIPFSPLERLKISMARRNRGLGSVWIINGEPESFNQCCLNHVLQTPTEPELQFLQQPCSEGHVGFDHIKEALRKFHGA